MPKSVKKGGATALQTEVTSEEDWAQIVERKGLVVVDVYSEWSGPCSAMISTLRKIKMEIGGDTLSYAVARNDDISSLERFRGRSEPVWMFLENGKIVNLVFGAECPNLQRTLLKELRRVQNNEPPGRMVSIMKRVSEEESRWQRKESLRKAKEDRKIAQEEAAKKAKYEAYLEQEMFELCEETAIVLYPWIFLDEEGFQKDKETCPPYTELVREIFPQRFDVLEQTRIQLDEEMIEKMLVESNIEITDNLVAGLTEDKCLAMRIRCKPPPPEWPVPYPNECPKGTAKCPIRAINDVENYLRSILEAPPSNPNSEIVGSFLERHTHVHEPDEENEEDYRRIYPAVWFPPQARNKVYVYKTLFSYYMEKSHPYEEPVEPLPLCAFKFDATKFEILQDAYETFGSTIEKFGVFEYDDPPKARRFASNPQDFQNKVINKTGDEIFVVIIRRSNDEVFLNFAGNDPIFVSEDHDESQRMLDEYFPPGSIDVLPEVSDDENDYYDDYEEAEEDEGEEEDEEFDRNPEVPPSFVDLSMF